jgi:glycosyltransferase involved in cell wall biosynthesis/Flp pilus assembly protein TadD/uncharacterized Rossmann fold enzyme
MNDDAPNVIAKNFIKKGAFKNAITTLINHLSTHNDDSDAVILLAQAFAKSGQKDKAQQLLEHRYAIQPWNHAVGKALINYYLDEALKLEEALDICRSIMRQCPYDLINMLLFANITNRLGEKELSNSAISIIKKLKANNCSLPLGLYHFIGIPIKISGNYPMVSIVMAAFNAAATIGESIESILKQSYQNWELLIIDDGSTDDTLNISSLYVNKDKRIRVLPNKSKGVSSARNLGISKSRGDFIAFLDADDIYYDNAIAFRAQLLASQNEISAVFCETELTDCNLKPLGWVLSENKAEITFNDFYGNPVHLNALMVKKAILEEKCVIFDEQLTNGEDWLFQSRIARSGIIFYKAPFCRVAYRQSKSVVRNNFLLHENKILEILEMMFREDPGCLKPSEAYRYGIKKPEKEKIIVRRRIGLLVYLALSKDSKNVEKVGKELLQYKISNSDLPLIIDSIKFAVVRACCCKVSDWYEYFKRSTDLLKLPLEKFVFQNLIEEHSRSEELENRLSASYTLSVNETRSSLGETLIYLPGFNQVKNFVDQYWRMIWYFKPVIDKIDCIHVGVSCNIPENICVPDYLDPAIKNLEKFVAPKLQFFDSNDSNQWDVRFKNSTITMVWNEKYNDNIPSVEIYKSYKGRIKTLSVDKNCNRYEGSYYLSVSRDLNPFVEQDLEICKNKFQKMVGLLNAFNKCYIFGTGPSLEEAFDHDFSDGIVIACNSMVKNKPLLKHLNPSIIVIADPIFHAGCSSYAGEFRNYLCNALDSYNAFLIVPFRDYKLYLGNLDEKYHDRIIGLPFEHLERVNLDILKKYVVKTTSNVLTLFLIPIASTLSKEVHIMGCDGRKIEENNYFWTHHKDSQINEQMGNIKIAHPAFFKIDYNDYYLEHCETLENWLSTGESKGISYFNMTPSYIPAMQKRHCRKNKGLCLNGKQQVLGQRHGREIHARLDENQLVLKLLSFIPDKGAVISVGVDSSDFKLPFTEAGHRVYAFDHDLKNGAKLSEKIDVLPIIPANNKNAFDLANPASSYFVKEKSDSIVKPSGTIKSESDKFYIDSSTLSEVVSKKEIHNLNYLKIDSCVDARMLLKDFTWEKCKPDVILCKFEAEKTTQKDSKFHQIAQYLLTQGYTVLVSEWHPKVYAIPHDWKSLSVYPCTLTSADAWGSIIGIHDEKNWDKIFSILTDCIIIGVEKKSIISELHRKKIERFKNLHKGQRCVIIGNGPSLNKMDLSFLENEICFGMNRIYLLFEKWKFRPTYYTAVNPLLLEQSVDEILEIKAPKFLSNKAAPFFKNASDDIIFVQSIPKWYFSYDPCEGLCEGWTVTFFSMQLAYYMGFKEVVLIGVDHHYVTQGKPNSEVESQGNDANHFHPEYFGKGTRWNLPDLEKAEFSYKMARQAFEADGRRIIDATVGGRLSIFKKVDYKKHFSVNDGVALYLTAKCSDAINILRKAQELTISRQFDEAIDLLKNACRLIPNDASLQFALGLLLEKRGERKLAVSYFESAVKIAPENAGYMKKLAFCYHDTCGKSGEALCLLQRALEINDNDHTAYQAVAQICKCVGRLDDADYFNEIAQKIYNSVGIAK